MRMYYFISTKGSGTELIDICECQSILIPPLIIMPDILVLLCRICIALRRVEGGATERHTTESFVLRLAHVTPFFVNLFLVLVRSVAANPQQSRSHRRTRGCRRDGLFHLAKRTRAPPGIREYFACLTRPHSTTIQHGIFTDPPTTCHVSKPSRVSRRVMAWKWWSTIAVPSFLSDDTGIYRHIDAQPC